MPQASTPSLPRFDSMLFATLQSASLRPTSAWRECVRTCFPPPSSSSSGGAPASSSGTAFVVPSPLTSRRAADPSRDCVFFLIATTNSEREEADREWTAARQAATRIRDSYDRGEERRYRLKTLGI